MKCISTLICILSFTLVFGQVEVDFVADQTVGCEIANISFTDLSTSTAGAIVSWDWLIGTVESELQNPGAIFNEVGSYTICLAATDTAGNIDTLCKEDYINIFPNPVADFSFTQNSVCSPSEVIFTDLSTASSDIVNWIWDIGGTSNIINSLDP